MASCVSDAVVGVVVALFSLNTIAMIGAIVWYAVKNPEQVKSICNFLKLSEKYREQAKRRRTRFEMKITKKQKKEKWEIKYKSIKFSDRIGVGNFGEVWKATWVGSEVAVKTILPRVSEDEEFVSRFVAEIKLMSTLCHPNIVMFLGAVTKPPHYCLVLEYCTFGNMHDFLQEDIRGRKVVTLAMIYKFAVDIARGVNYLHSKMHIIQRDLKSRNVLVDTNYNAKLADFGLSRLQKEDGGMTACGTPAWTAPEIVKMEKYDERCDVYSFGIVLWELYCRQEPYDGQGGLQIAYAAAEQGLRPVIPTDCPTGLADLMRKCWSEKPQDRPDFNTILKQLFAMLKGAR